MKGERPLSKFQRNNDNSNKKRGYRAHALIFKGLGVAFKIIKVPTQLRVHTHSYTLYLTTRIFYRIDILD